MKHSSFAFWVVLSFDVVYVAKRPNTNQNLTFDFWRSNPTQQSVCWITTLNNDQISLRATLVWREIASTYFSPNSRLGRLLLAQSRVVCENDDDWVGISGWQLKSNRIARADIDCESV